MILSVVEGTEYRCKEEPDIDARGESYQRRSGWLSADGHTIHDNTAMKCLEDARVEQRRQEHDKYIERLRAELWPEGSR